MTNFLQSAVHLLARLSVFFTHRAIRIAPGVSIFALRSDKRADVDIVREALRNLTNVPLQGPRSGRPESGG